MQHDERTTRTTKIFIILAAVCLLIAGFIQFFLTWDGFGVRDMRMQSTGNAVTFGFESSAAFHSNDANSFFFMTADGMRHILTNGTTDWQRSFNFNRPVMVSNGNYVAVGEASGGRVVYVFGNNSSFYRVDFEHPILVFSVNETGWLTTIVSYDNGFGVYVHNQQRTDRPLFNLPLRSPLITPLTAQVSADGRYIAIAMLDMDIVPRSIVQFRYINASDARGTADGLFAAETFARQTVTAVQFMDNNRVIVATTGQISGFQLGPAHATKQELWTISLYNQLSHIEFTQTHFAFITGDKVHEVYAEDVGTVKMFHVDGTPTGYFSLGRRATHLSMGHNALIAGTDRIFNAFDLRGQHLWEYITLHDTRDFLFLENTNTVLVAGNTRADVRQRRAVREDLMAQQQ